MSLAEFTDWLYNTPVSQTIQTTAWIIPFVQSIHILAIAAVVGSSIVLDLKLAGIVARADSAAVVFRRYMPWVWWALAVLLATGVVMIVGEPERTLGNRIFWLKMGLLAIAFVLTLIMRVPMLRADLGDQSRVWSALVKPIGLLAIVIWAAIIICGRWIAYVI